MTNTRKITRAVCVAPTPWDHFADCWQPSRTTTNTGRTVLSSHGDSSANHGRHSTVFFSEDWNATLSPSAISHV